MVIKLVNHSQLPKAKSARGEKNRTRAAGTLEKVPRKRQHPTGNEREGKESVIIDLEEGNQDRRSRRLHSRNKARAARSE
jgi:hypothetical protein